METQVKSPLDFFPLWIQDPITFSGNSLLLLKQVWQGELLYLVKLQRCKMSVDLFNKKAIIFSE